VTFADTNLSFKVRQRIASDLTIVFSPATSFEVAQGGGGQGVEATIALPGGGTSVITHNGRDYWEGAFKPYSFACMLPDEMREGVFLVDYDNQKSVRMTKAASDKYLQALVWVDAHSNTVKKAHEFVALLNSPDLLSKPIQVLKDLGHSKPLSNADENNPPSDAEIRAVFEKHICSGKYPGISVLNFYVKQVPEIGNAKIPMALLFAINKADPEPPDGIDAVPIGFYKGKWGFGNFPSPD